MPSFPRNQFHEDFAHLGTMTPQASSSDVARKLIQLLTSGGVAPGSRLPPERQLQAQLGVGRSAVREALAALALLGIVESRPGSGTFMRDSTSSLLPAALSWGMMLNAEHTSELTDLRTTLETRATVLACRNIDEAALAHLASLLEQMRDAEEFEAFVEADAGFHRTIAEQSGNTVLRELLKSVNSLLRVWVERSAKSYEHTRTATREHERILHALSLRDVDDAVDAMAEHMHTATLRIGRDQGAFEDHRTDRYGDDWTDRH